MINHKGLDENDKYKPETHTHVIEMHLWQPSMVLWKWYVFKLEYLRCFVTFLHQVKIVKKSNDKGLEENNQYLLLPHVIAIHLQYSGIVLPTWYEFRIPKILYTPHGSHP